MSKVSYQNDVGLFLTKLETLSPLYLEPCFYGESDCHEINVDISNFTNWKKKKIKKEENTRQHQSIVIMFPAADDGVWPLRFFWDWNVIVDEQFQLIFP